MRLLRIHLANFRGVTDRELTFAEHGVTVVEGPNESGKSSTIEAFGLLLDELDSSRKEAVRAVKPRHSDASPEVEAEFRVGGYHVVYRKRWIRPLTELRVLAPTPETLTGREAHERVLAILNQATDYDLFKALRVLQDKPFDVDRIAGSASLRAALDAAAGGASGPGDGSEDTLVQRVEKEFARYFTAKNHQPTGEYRAAQEAAASTTAEAAELAQTLARVEADTERHGEVTVRLAELQRRLLTDRADLDDFTQRAKAVEMLRARRDDAAALVERASRDAELAAGAWEARQALVQSVSGYEGELATLSDQIAAHTGLRTEAEARRNGASAMHRAADEAYRLALRRYQDADADYRWMRDAYELERVRADREALAEADREVELAAAETAATEIDDRAVDAIDKADRSVRDARTAIEVAAATVRIERLGSAAVTVSVPDALAADGSAATAAASVMVEAERAAAPNAGLGAAAAGTAGPGVVAATADLRAAAVVTADPGAAALPEARTGAAESVTLVPGARTAADLADPLVRRLTDPLVIEAEGVLRVTLAPGASERELRAKLDTAESALATLCLQAGVRDLASARVRLQRHVEARASLLAAESARKKLSKDPAALADEQARLEARIADHLDRRDPGVLPPAGRDEAETVAEHRRAESEEAAANLERAADALRLAEARANDVAAEAQKLAGRAEQAAAELEAARTRLAEARLAADDPVVEQRAADAARTLATAVQDRAAHDANYRDAQPEQVELLLRNARDVVARTESEIANAREALQNLAGRLDAVGDDLADRHREAEARRDAAERDLASVTARAEAAALLRKTILERREEATRSYQGPFKEQIERFGRLVFGASFSVTVDADLRVRARTLAGRTDPYAELSTGAREAVAMCVRLACAALVGPEGGVPVIIDDALGAADPDRRRTLGALLNHAGSAAAAPEPAQPWKPTQIIIFTCDPDRYRAVGSAQVRSLSHNNDRDESAAP